ncbi:MAG: GNAT family N-acetyltransferase [Dehalococcoidia bacterium]|nr:GNAT family N-acetyltransferase [Dehalococcoidia bacterium]
MDDRSDSTGSPKEFPLRDMLISDIDRVTDIHLRSFPGFFLSFLGPSFLKQFYSNMVESQHGIALVVCDQGEAVGFACGSNDISGFYRDLIRTKWLQLSLAALPSVLRRPSTAIRLLRAAFTRPGQASGQKSSGELSSIAIHPDWEARGLGRALLAAYMQAMKARGATELALSTDRDDNERVNAFYLHSGFSLAGADRTPEGRWLNKYTIKL